MKKLFIGIILFPVLIFAVGLVLILVGEGLNFILPSREKPTNIEDSIVPATEKSGAQTSATSSPKPVSKVMVKYAATQYYNATGSTKQEIRASMDSAKKGTFLEGHDASTVAEMDIVFSTAQSGNKCEAIITKFNLNLTYTYPKWTPLSGASSDLVAYWNKFISGMTVHEEGHAKIEIDRTILLLQELQKLPIDALCDEFNKRWRAKASAFDSETKKIHAQYDLETNSGKNQGGIF